MSLKTESFVLPPSDHLDILLRRALRRSEAPGLALAAVGAALTLSTRRLRYLVGALHAAALALGVRVALAWNHVYSDRNTQLFAWRHLEFDGGGIDTVFEDGVRLRTTIGPEASATRRPGYTLIHAGAGETVYVPHRAFASEADRVAFERWLSDKGL